MTRRFYLVMLDHRVQYGARNVSGVIVKWLSSVCGLLIGQKTKQDKKITGKIIWQNDLANESDIQYVKTKSKTKEIWCYLCQLVSPSPKRSQTR